MKIKSINPVLTLQATKESVAAFTEIGFTQKHHLNEDGKIDFYVMETEDGSRIDIMSNSEGNLPTAIGFRINVDNLDEAIEFFKAKDYEPLSSVITTPSNKMITMTHLKAGIIYTIVEHTI